MFSNNELYYTAKEVYLNHLEDKDRSELTIEEAEALLDLVEEVAEEMGPKIFLGDAVDEIVEELKRTMPKLHRNFNAADEILNQ